MKCNTIKKGCGCSGTTIPTMIDKETECNTEPCSELFSDECIMHTGEEMSINKNGSEFSVKKGDRFSEIIQRMMCFLCDEIGDIPIVRLYNITDTSVTVDIQNEESANIYYSCDDTWDNVVSSGSTYLLQNLTPNTEYRLYVVGNNSNNQSVTFKFKTK